MFNICPYVFRLIHNSLFRVSGFMALAIAKLLANGYVVGHRLSSSNRWFPINDSGSRKDAPSHRSQIRNQLFCETFLFNKYKSHRQPMHLGECPDFVVWPVTDFLSCFLVFGNSFFSRTDTLVFLNDVCKSLDLVVYIYFNKLRITVVYLTGHNPITSKTCSTLWSFPCVS